MDKDYYTEQREERLAKREAMKPVIIDGDSKTVNGRPFCEVKLKDLKDPQLYLDLD